MILEGQEVGGFFIEYDRDPFVHLEDRGRTTGRDRSFDHPTNCIRFFRTIGEQQAVPGFHDGGNAHGDDVPGNFFRIVKVDGIVFDGLFTENLDPGSGGKRSGGFVEADVSIGPNAKDLQVNSTKFFDFLFIIPAGLTKVACTAIRKMNSGGVYLPGQKDYCACSDGRNVRPPEEDRRIHQD